MCIGQIWLTAFALTAVLFTSSLGAAQGIPGRCVQVHCSCDPADVYQPCRENGRDFDCEAYCFRKTCVRNNQPVTPQGHCCSGCADTGFGTTSICVPGPC